MTTDEPAFHESGPSSTPIRELGLAIEGSPLEPVLAEFLEELPGSRDRPGRPSVLPLDRMGRSRRDDRHRDPVLPGPSRPGRPPGRAARVTSKGSGRADILRYLRHEMGHVVNYAYRLHESAEWVETFGGCRSPIARNIAPSRSAGDSSGTCPVGMPRSIRTRTGPRPSPSG